MRSPVTCLRAGAHVFITLVYFLNCASRCERDRSRRRARDDDVIELDAAATPSRVFAAGVHAQRGTLTHCGRSLRIRRFKEREREKKRKLVQEHREVRETSAPSPLNAALPEVCLLLFQLSLAAYARHRRRALPFLFSFYSFGGAFTAFPLCPHLF